MAKYMASAGCTLCGQCMYVCPASAIQLTPTGAFIDQRRCIQCGSCMDNCASEAIVETPEN